VDRLVGAGKLYSPECVEEEFSEVRGYKLPRPAPAIYQSRRGRATFSPLPRPYLLRLLLGSDTSCCDLLQPGLPRIPALPHPDKPCAATKMTRLRVMLQGVPASIMRVLFAALFYPAPVRQRGLRFAPPSALRGTSL
jgi:hypothetical protein